MAAPSAITPAQLLRLIGTDGCPWLIRRFVDPNARVLYVAPHEVIDVAERPSATPLDWLATVIRAADTDRHERSPEAAGLLAMPVGLSRLYRDDTAQLNAAIPLYDALYRWARDGLSESHSWPEGQS